MSRRPYEDDFSRNSMALVGPPIKKRPEANSATLGGLLLPDDGKGDRILSLTLQGWAGDETAHIGRVDFRAASRAAAVILAFSLLTLTAPLQGVQSSRLCL